METTLHTEYVRVLITVVNILVYLGEWCIGAEYEPRRCEGPHTERGGHP